MCLLSSELNSSARSGMTFHDIEPESSSVNITLGRTAPAERPSRGSWAGAARAGTIWPQQSNRARPRRAASRTAGGDDFIACYSIVRTMDCSHTSAPEVGWPAMSRRKSGLKPRAVMR